MGGCDIDIDVHLAKIHKFVCDICDSEAIDFEN